MGRIRDFADQAHGNQMRKYTGDPYIVHPQRVMEICREYTGKNAILAAALLHDVLEDTDVDSETIFDFLTGVMGYSSAKKALHIVEELTDKYEKKSYPQWNRDKRKYMEAERLAKVSADAQTVKYADIIDNTPDIVEGDPGFGKRYIQEVKTLLSKMTKGHPKLRQRALKVVNESGGQLREKSPSNTSG